MKFNLRFSFWQWRGESRKMALIVFCVALGVSARVAVGSFLNELSRSLVKEARTLLSADLEVASRTPLDPKTRSELLSALPPGSETQEMMSFVTMAATRKGVSRLVEIRAVEEAYPFFGKLEITDGAGSVRRKVDGRDASVAAQRELLSQLGMKLGEPLKLGQKEFPVSGVISQDPGLGGSVFSLGPKILIPMEEAKKTGLVQMGSRVYFSVLVKLADASLAEGVAENLRSIWKIPKRHGHFRESMGPESGISVRSARDKQEQIAEFFDRLGDYLRLVSLMALLLGGIGVGSVVRGYVAEQLRTAATLLALGASRSRVLSIFTVQVAELGIAGSAVGTIFGALLQGILPKALAGFMPIVYEGRFDFYSAGIGLLLGVLTSLFFGLLPVFALRHLKPLEIIRGDESAEKERSVPWAFGALGAAVLALTAVLESRSVVKGLFFAGSFLGAGGILFGLARVLLPAIARLRRIIPAFGIKHGISNLARPGLEPDSAFAALGLSAFLLGTLAVYQYSLLKELDPGKRPDRIPVFFLIDVQDGQADDLRGFLKSKGVERFILSPMVKARYRGKNFLEPQDGKSLTREDEESRFFRNREQNLSFREGLGENEELVAGRWISEGSGRMEASVEQRFAERLGVKMGDVLNFDVQGVRVDAAVTSLRKVNWSSFLPTFFLYLSPRALIDAPKTWVGSILGVNPAGKEDLQMSLVQEFPNVTIIDVSVVAEKILAILRKISLAVKWIALFSAAASLVVLMGMAVASSRRRRTEAVLLKVLGSPRRTVFLSVVSEFGALSAVSVSIGLALSAAFTRVLLSHFLDIPFAFPLSQMALIGAALVALSAAAGLLMSRSVFRAKPMELLREGS